MSETEAEKPEPLKAKPTRQQRRTSRASDEVDTVIEEIFSARLRKRLGNRAPVSVQSLLTSRGVGVRAVDLLTMALEATLDLPPSRFIDPDRGLTESELAVLKRGGFDSADTGRNVAPVAQGIAEYSAMVAKSLSVAEAARRVGVEESRIRQRLGERTVYGFKVGRGWRLPSFQFDRKGLVPGISEVIRALPADLHPVAVLTWFTSPNVDLPKSDPEETPMSPLDWLRSGNDPKEAAGLASDL